MAATDFVKNSANKHNAPALRSYTRCRLHLGFCLADYGRVVVDGAVVEDLWNWVCGGRNCHAFVSGWDAWCPLVARSHGHLLSAVGRADLNTYVNGVVFALTAAACWLAIPRWGIMGAAGVMAGMLWLSGVLYAVVFELH